MSSQEVTTISRIDALRHQRTQLMPAAREAPSQQQGRTVQRSVYQLQYLQQPTAHGPLGVGSAFMLGHGTLQVLSSTQGRGGLIYNAVYNSAMAMNIASSSYSDFRPIQDALVAEHLESYREDISDAESVLGIASIRATLTPEGNFAITDDHHVSPQRPA